jgi:inorganic triphosphatase YgiF
MKPTVKIEVCEEPEIQYAASPELFDEIRAWLKARGGVVRKSEKDTAVYYDTKNNRLMREGIEYRVKEKDGCLRHDMKTPLNTASREVVPDSNDILWRNELKFRTPKAKPRLTMFFGQALLVPVQDRVSRFFNKELIAKFRSRFAKEKIDYVSGVGIAKSKVEYSLQSGQMETIDGKRKTRPLYILELELREGGMEMLLEEKAAVEEKFGPKGLTLLRDRKVLLGFELLQPDMNGKQRQNLQEVIERNRASSQPELESCVPEQWLPV